MTNYYCLIITFLFFCFPKIVVAQATLPYSQIYAAGLDGNIPKALDLLEVDTTQLSQKDKLFKAKFEKRFKTAKDLGTSIGTEAEQLEELLAIFQKYWHTSLRNPNENYDRELGKEATQFLKTAYPITKDKVISRDSLGTYLSNYIQSKGYFTTKSVGKTGKLFDLLIWKSQKDSNYIFSIGKEKMVVKVVMMQDFITLGWGEYATFGRHHPGGWTTKEALFCVEKAYDLESEDFKVSYLAHEGRHYADYQLFSNLKSADLEYRAKLTELSLAQTTLYQLIHFFVNNANKDSRNGHSVANNKVIKDLSKKIFSKEFEPNIEHWKKITSKKINKAAAQLLKQDTESLKKNH